MFYQRVITNISIYNIRMLKAKWRQQELVGFLERNRIDVCAIQEYWFCYSDSRSPNLYSRVLHFPGRWRLVTHTADDNGWWCRVSRVSNSLQSLDKVEYKSDRVMQLQFSGHPIKELPRFIWFGPISLDEKPIAASQ